MPSPVWSSVFRCPCSVAHPVSVSWPQLFAGDFFYCFAYACYSRRFPVNRSPGHGGLVGGHVKVPHKSRAISVFLDGAERAFVKSPVSNIPQPMSRILHQRADKCKRRECLVRMFGAMRQFCDKLLTWGRRCLSREIRVASVVVDKMSRVTQLRPSQ
jgi:hypothetical protein